MRYTRKLLAGLLAAYFVLGVSRTAVLLAEAGDRVQTLEDLSAQLDEEIHALSQEEAGQLRWEAWRQLGLVSPEDVVFFDGG